MNQFFSMNDDETDMNEINLSKFDDGAIIVIIKTYFIFIKWIFYSSY